METSQLNLEKQSRNRTHLAGLIISWLCILFLLVDGIMKVARATPSVDGTVSMGFSDGTVQPLGLAILCFTILYSIPRTAVFGAVMLTAHLGGAVAVTIQQFHGTLQFLFPLIFCVVLWAGLFLRDEKLREILPIRKYDQ